LLVLAVTFSSLDTSPPVFAAAKVAHFGLVG
jgi:hypothetical protein